MGKRLFHNTVATVLFAAYASTASAGATLKLAVVAPLSGPAALWGQTLRGAVVLAANEVNEAGGLRVGEATYKVEVTSYDDQFQIDKTVAAANRIAFQDGIQFVIGTAYSPGVLAAKPIFERAKILSFVGGWSRKILDPASNFTYRVGDSVVEFMPPILEWMSQSGAVHGKTVVLFGQNDEGGLDNRRIAEENYPKFGFQIVGAESYERTTKDFQPALTRLLPLNPAFIDIGPSPPALAGLIVRQAREMGFKGQFVKLGGAGPREIIAAAGKDSAEGLLQFIPADPETDAFKRLNAAYQKLYGSDMDTSGLVSYDTAKLLFASIAKAGTTSDTAKVKEALDSTRTFPSVMGGTLKLSGKENYGVDRQFNGPFYVGEIVDGRVRIVATCAETCRDGAQPTKAP
jgi:branched-chain amino acid transport system substrate-binding protein